MTRIFTILSVLFLISILLVGCKKPDTPTENPSVPTQTTVPATEPPRQSFERAGISLELPENFRDYSEYPMSQEYEFLYASDFVGIFAIQESKDTVNEAVTTLETYCTYQASVLSGEAAQNAGIWTITYQDLTQNEPQTYICAVYETEDAYWTVKSYCPSDLYETYKEAMLSYVTAVTFNEL